MGRSGEARYNVEDNGGVQKNNEDEEGIMEMRRRIMRMKRRIMRMKRRRE